MNAKGVSIGIGLVLILGAGLFLWSKRSKAPARPETAFYHTPAGVNAHIQDQRIVLSEALAEEDLPTIHGQVYYVQGLADALAGKLEGDTAQRMGPRLAELKLVAEEVDNFSGRGNLEATRAGLTKMFEIFDALNAEFAHPPE